MYETRYAELVQGIPEGPFYQNDGAVLPYKDGLYPFSLETGEANTRYALIVNDQLIRHVETDAEGIAAFDIKLPKGECEIVLESQRTLRRTRKYVTTREYAAWFAAWAGVIGRVDEQIEQLLAEARLEGSPSPGAMSEVWGDLVSEYYTDELGIEAYRDLIRQLRHIYRRLGATRAGIDAAVSAITKFRPYQAPLHDLARWPLGWQMLPNRKLTLGQDRAVPDGCILSAGLAATRDGEYLILTAADADDGYLVQEVDRSIWDWRGYTTTLHVWARDESGSASIVLGVSFDGGTTWAEGDPTALTASPANCAHVIEVPLVRGGQVLVRTRFTGRQAGASVALRGMALPLPTGGFFLGRGTVVRSQHRSKRGEAIYFWCPDRLTTRERASLGLDGSPGHPQKVAPAHSALELLDVSERVDGEPVNMAGAWDEVGFMSGLMTGMSMILRSPERYTIVQPDRSSTVIARLGLLPHTKVATLEIPGDTEQDAVVMENAVPILRSEWEWIGPTQIRILKPLTDESVLAIRYNALIRFETAPLDLGPGHADYLWLADWQVQYRDDGKLGEVEQIDTLIFNASLVADLSQYAKRDKNLCVLVATNGRTETAISPDAWEFVSDRSIRLANDAFDGGSTYRLTYRALTIVPADRVGAYAAVRSAATLGDLAVAEWRQVQPNDPVDRHLRYHQLSIRFTGIGEPGDAKLGLLGVKGLKLFAGDGVPLLGRLPA